jgi:inorganic pyrophosphatase
LNLKYLPIGDDTPRIVNAIVEIPKGSRNKYEYNVDLGVFQLDRVLFSSMHYPEAYGFIPSTLYEDGDPVDVLIVIDQPLQTGIMLEVRPIGILKMQDEKGSDDKIISVAKHDPTYSSIKEIKALPRHTLVEIEHFFTSSKESMYEVSGGMVRRNLGVRSNTRQKLLREICSQGRKRPLHRY